MYNNNNIVLYNVIIYHVICNYALNYQDLRLSVEFELQLHTYPTVEHGKSYCIIHGRAVEFNQEASVSTSSLNSGMCTYNFMDKVVYHRRHCVGS